MKRTKESFGMRRFAMVAATWVVSLAMGAPAAAADIKIATVAPEGSQWMKDIRAAAAAIKTRTEGRVVIKVYGGGVMGSEKQVLRKMRIGQLQGGAFTASAIAERYPDVVLYGLPMVFRSQDEVSYVRQRMDATLIDGLERAGLVTFGFAGGGFARIFANRPVMTTADMRGQKIWLPDGDRITSAALEALQLSPVGLPVTDVLTGLQTGLLDIVAAPPVGVIALQWHTRLKFMTSEPLMYTMGLMAIDAGAFGRLGAVDQAVFREVMSTTYRRFDEQSRTDDESSQKALLTSGIKRVDASPAEVKAWREAVTAANQRLGEQGVYTPALLGQVQALLQEVRQAPGPAVAGRP
jgi:TRAP-type C4-dicarboxylate transport system substrate-binding protein